MAEDTQRDGGNDVRRCLGRLLVLIALLVGCTPADGPGELSSAAPPPYGADHPYPLPPPAAQADYQLGVAYPPPQGTTVLARDRSADPEPGAYNICYINALQVQPEEISWWEANHPELLIRRGDGVLVTDSEWGEPLLDVSTPEQRAALLAIQAPWIDDCAAAGFAAVEPDNQDTYFRGGPPYREVIAYLTEFTAYAHSRGLAVAQKNGGPELGTIGRSQIGFDFAITEECAVWRECPYYVEVYGPYVIEIEYTDQPESAYDDSCAAYAGHHSIVRRDRQLVGPGDPGYSYASC